MISTCVLLTSIINSVAKRKHNIASKVIIKQTSNPLGPSFPSSPVGPLIPCEMKTKV